jgi:peptidoglycan hydrolase CwlO-like protein
MTIDQRIEFLMQSSESHDRQIGELTENIGKLAEKIDKQSENIDKLVAVTNDDAIAIRTLARIADAHEGRIARMEDIQ